MSFWAGLEAFGDAPALVFGHDAATVASVSYAALAAEAGRFEGKLPPAPGKRLGMILCENALPAIAAYMGALRAGDAVMLLNSQTEASLLSVIVESYRPDWIFRRRAEAREPTYAGDGGNGPWELLARNTGGSNATLHADLAVLLSTSGTTGNPKMVRLSHRNIDSNAAAIAQYLAIAPSTRAVTTLPFNYSFGMSVVNSHLAVGASLLVTEQSLMSREFWDGFSLHGVSSLPGVPYTFQMLQRLNPQKLPLQSLTTLTQAGGALSAKLTDYFQELAAAQQWRFFVMYGQTEASPRISYVPPEQLAAKRGSIGIAIPGGKLTLGDDGELFYEGPNVMMGYADSRQDLARGDDLQGRLATGDLARCDADGFFYVEGRRKRFIKIHGNRINLDDVELRLEARHQSPVAVLGSDDKLQVFLTAGSDLQASKDELMQTYRLHPTTFALYAVETIPHTSSGKKDYARLKP